MQKITGFLILITTALLSLNCFAQVPAQTLQIAGLKGSVSVRRDARSIPYIKAENEADLYFAQGFVTASDRLWQMDLLRRVARGQSAELFGKLTLEEDKRWRKLGFSKIADDSLPFLNADLKAALENYARGVNAYIATLDKNSMPTEFRILQYQPTEWKPTDSIVIGKILSDALSTTWQQDLLRSSVNSLPADKIKDLLNQTTPYDVVLYGKDAKKKFDPKAEPEKSKAKVSDYSPESKKDAENLAKLALDELQVRKRSLERIGFYAEDLAASNNWVISGKKTADGRPILANDPHLQPSAPGIWYLAHLASPNVRVSGATFPGSPGIVLGHNENIAWGATNVGPDVQDLYLETFNADGKYQTPNGLQMPTTRREEIKVRANPFKTDTESVMFDVVETAHGVIYTESGGKKYALRWTARDPKNNELDAFFLLNRAQNWNDFQSSLKTYGGAAQNFVYADVKGNIGWYAAGKIPTRSTGDGSVPYNGATGEGEWTGYIPFEELPHLYNPSENLIVTANQRTVGTDYQYYSIFARDAALPWRARRIYETLKDKNKITMDDVRDAQYDVQNIPLSRLAQEIVKRNAASPETLEVLKSWDGRMNVEAKGAVLANEIRNCLGNKIADDNAPIPAYAIRERILWWAIEQNAVRWLPKGFKDYDAMLKTCDAESRSSLTQKIGAEPQKWIWGALFKARFPHPLAAAPLIGAQFAVPDVPLDGSGQTPDVGSSVSMRHIASPGNWDATRHVIPLGESGNPASPFYKDQFDAWRNGVPMIFPFSKNAVEGAAKSLTTLAPK